MLAQAILYRGAGLDVVWRQFVVLFAIGASLFAYALARLPRHHRHDGMTRRRMSSHRNCCR
jgi:hypothetical protein